MGYSTYFTLNKIQGSDEDFNALVKDIEEKSGVDFSEENGQSARWYDYYEDMTALSKKYPDLVVQLDGDGEDSDDIWEARFHNGNVETVGFEMLPFCQIATRDERVSFLVKNYGDARKNFLKLIRCVVEEAGGDMTVRVLLRETPEGKTWCNHILVKDDELHFQTDTETAGGKVVESGYTHASGLTIAEAYAAALGVMKLKHI